MLKLNTKQLEKLEYPIALPQYFWIVEDGKDYYYGYRSINCILEETKTPFLISKYKKGLVGTMCWVCLDTTNGNPELYHGRLYCWIFKTKEQALKQYRTHKENKQWATIRAPVCCIIVDQLTVSNNDNEQEKIIDLEDRRRAASLLISTKHHSKKTLKKLLKRLNG